MKKIISPILITGLFLALLIAVQRQPRHSGHPGLSARNSDTFAGLKISQNILAW